MQQHNRKGTHGAVPNTYRQNTRQQQQPKRYNKKKKNPLCAHQHTTPQTAALGHCMTTPHNAAKEYMMRCRTEHMPTTKHQAEATRTNETTHYAHTNTQQPCCTWPLHGHPTQCNAATRSSPPHVNPPVRCGVRGCLGRSTTHRKSALPGHRAKQTPQSRRRARHPGPHLSL